MRIRDIKEQFNKILKYDLIQFIDNNNFIRRHPNYPLISNIELYPDNINLDEDQIDSLNDGESVKIQCYIPGQYKRTQINGTLSVPDSFFTLNETGLKIILEDEQIKIQNCNCFATVN
jgi:hypothetical protein